MFLIGGGKFKFPFGLELRSGNPNFVILTWFVCFCSCFAVATALSSKYLLILFLIAYTLSLEVACIKACFKSSVILS